MLATSRPIRLSGLASLMIVLSLLAGCGRNKSYVPSTPSARQALEAALTAWQNGRAAGTIDTVTPPVQVVDSTWMKGRKLARYEIVDEESRDDGNRWFRVRLHLDAPAGTSEARYVVVGRSPLWIYREEDYKRSHSWEGYK